MLTSLLLTAAGGIIAGQFHGPFGVAPILGAILCAAFFLKPKQLFLIGLGGMVVRDLLMGLSLFTLVRLIAIALVVAVVVALKIRPTVRSLLVGLFTVSPIFHLTLAVGDWWTGTCSTFPKTGQGLLASIHGSLPYLERSLVGDTVFTALFLLGYTIVACFFSRREVVDARV